MFFIYINACETGLKSLKKSRTTIFRNSTFGTFSKFGKQFVQIWIFSWKMRPSSAIKPFENFLTSMYPRLATVKHIYSVGLTLETLTLVIKKEDGNSILRLKLFSMLWDQHKCWRGPSWDRLCHEIDLVWDNFEPQNFELRDFFCSSFLFCVWARRQQFSLCVISKKLNFPMYSFNDLLLLNDP